jgi:signal transduction histidine kinase
MVQVWLQQREPGRAVRTRLDGSVATAGRVMGWRDELVNLVINLIVNARDAMPDGGVVTLGAGRASPTVVLWIEDEGVGIPEDMRERIFEPFFSTKGKGGMGMGLAMARQIMRGLGGDITAHSRPGKGARFEVRFQPAPPTMESQQSHADQNSAGG